MVTKMTHSQRINTRQISYIHHQKSTKCTPPKIKTNTKNDWPWNMSITSPASTIRHHFSFRGCTLLENSTACPWKIGRNQAFQPSIFRGKLTEFVWGILNMGSIPKNIPWNLVIRDSFPRSSLFRDITKRALTTRPKDRDNEALDLRTNLKKNPKDNGMVQSIVNIHIYISYTSYCICKYIYLLCI